MDGELLEPLQHQVVAAVLETLGVRDQARAAGCVDRRTAVVVVLVSVPQQHHADDPIAGQRFRDHLAIPRLEDVQR
jgi:hypothetical protein